MSTRLRSRTVATNIRAEEMRPNGWARVVARRRDGALTWHTVATAETFEDALEIANRMRTTKGAEQ